MRIQMGIVAMENVTIEAVSSVKEDVEHFIKAEQAREDGKKPRPESREVFDDARRRFASQGAESVRYFMVG